MFTHVLCGQNLILNPGLENVDPAYELPNPPLDTFDLHNIPGWFNPGFGTTDYYNCDGKHPNYGSRFFGREMKAHRGNGYAGIYIEHSKWKEYIGCVFSDTLVKGKNYRLSLWLALSPRSRYAVNTLQVEFWDTSFVKVAWPMSDYPAENPKYLPLNLTRTNQISMVGTWTQFTVDFTAVGGEKSFVLGYFSDLWQSTSMPETAKNRSNDPYAYYYIDDVELVEIAGPPIPRKTVSRPVIYFDTDKDIIKKQFFAPLDSVADVMKKNAHMTLIVNGYTDSIGNVEDNLDLSKRRAEAVKKYLVDKGISETRITTAWYAESRPAGTSNAENRRVEFVYKP